MGMMLSVRHHPDFVVYRVGVIMVAQMFGDESVDDLAVLLGGGKLVRQGKFDFAITAIASRFVLVSSLEKIFGVVMRPFWQVVRVKNTAATIGERFFAIDIFDVRKSRMFFQSL